MANLIDEEETMTSGQGVDMRDESFELLTNSYPSPASAEQIAEAIELLTNSYPSPASAEGGGDVDMVMNSYPSPASAESDTGSVEMLTNSYPSPSPVSAEAGEIVRNSYP